MKKTIYAIISIFIFLSFLSHPLNLYAKENAPIRVINVVYDDSGSMIITGGSPVDTWCKAKYSMEVFAALLGNNDTMNIFVMSEFDNVGEVSDSPRLTLTGSSGADNNVKKVHEMITEAGNTPFYSVEKAYENLVYANAEEKWLVILTDGEFEDGAFKSSQVEEYLSHKQDNINVMFLGMGASAASINADEENHIFSEKAETNDQILSKITEISTRIFNSNKLEVDVNTGSFNFDIPMSELVVFAQGEDVHINGIVTGDGQNIGFDKTPVSVRYSEKPSSKGFTDFIVDKGLVGSVATFTGDFDAGDYTVDATGAKTIEIYYKPNVEIMLYLIGEDGNEAAYTEGVRAGDYKIGLGFVKAGTDKRISESRLLGDIRYSAGVQFNGTDDSKEYKPGDSITIKEGNYVINATADYLKYNSVSTQIEFEVYRNKDLLFTKTDSLQYQLDKEGFLNADKPMTFELTLEGEPISAEDWASFSAPVVEQISHTDKRVRLKAEKLDEPGRIDVYPELTEGKTTIGDYGSIDYRLSISNTKGKSTWTGSVDDTCEIKDLRSWFWRHIDKVIKLAILAAIAFILLGYVPGFKKYLPKKLARAPVIECESTDVFHRRFESSGKFTKNMMSVVLPYKAETGTIRYLPQDKQIAPSLSVKAIGSNRMVIVNTRAFAGRTDVKFNGMPIKIDEKKKKEATAGLCIKVEGSQTKYTCMLNKKKGGRKR